MKFMKTVRLSENILNQLRKNGEAWGKVYTYMDSYERLDDGTWLVYRWRTYCHNDCGFRLCTFDYAQRNGLLETVLVKGV